MDLRLVEIFCRVYEHRSFSRAAHELGLTQPTVSAHVKELEQSIGTALFNRLGRDIEPTEAGRFLHEHAQGILTLKRDLAARMAGFLNRIEGLLTIGASSVPGENLLPGLVTAFHAQYPGIRARVRISDSADTTDDVRRGHVELGVVGATTTDGELEFEPFADDELVLALPAGRRWPRKEELPLAEVRSLPLLVREVGSGTRTVLERALARRKLVLSDFNVAAELGSAGAIREAVRAGHGVSFVSRLAVPPDKGVRIATVRELGSVSRTYHIVSSRRRALSPATRAFLEFLRSASPLRTRGRGRRR